jgi:hypothetical protein
MALFRIAAAAGLLLALAPEETLKVVRSAFGLAEEARQLQVPAGDAAAAYCKANPSVCLEAVRQAASVGANAQAPQKSSKP